MLAVLCNNITIWADDFVDIDIKDNDAESMYETIVDDLSVIDASENDTEEIEQERIETDEMITSGNEDIEENEEVVSLPIYESAASIVKFGSTSIQLQYGPGGYFTDNGKACSDHSTKGIHSYYDESACNCICTYNGKSLGAVQCFGYGRYIQTVLFGSNSNYYLSRSN